MSENNLCNVVVSQFAKEDLNDIEKPFKGFIALCMKFVKKMSSFIQLLTVEEIFDEALIAKLMRYIKK